MAALTEPEQPWRHVEMRSGTMEPDGKGGMRPAAWCRFCGLDTGWPWPCDAERMRIERDAARARVEELDRQLANCGAALVKARRAEKGAPF